jgi:Skp family chaperone for outer membrane proteins
MRKNNKKVSKKSLIFISLSLLGFGAIYFADATFIRDQITASLFSPSAEVAELKDKIDLTSSGSRILLASEPELETRTNFNENCKSHDRSISVLGCYASGKIHVYNIENPELAGINEVTLAHELLHAVWARLSSREKSRLEPVINSVYENNKNRFYDRLINYDEADWTDELHSIIGTECGLYSDDTIFEIAEDATGCLVVNSILQDHYGKYFQDHAKVISLFNKYNSKFEALQKEAEETREKIDTLKAEIEAKNDEYIRKVDELNAKIADLKRRAENGYFTSAAAFNAERNRLNAEVDAANNIYHETVDMTHEVNALISAYNSNILRSKDLSESMNSNITPPSTGGI